MELSQRTSSGSGRPYCRKFAKTFSFSPRPLSARMSMSVPMQKAPKLAHATRMDPVPANGSRTMLPCRTCAMFAMIRESSLSMDVGPK
eukprot:CAMPEP_0185797490 /NCGR_PEP_ID=MMETSP1174-20130828/161645_1 /TAXON_ID=35687 /ORGANISM="Dictyocha speculum, Strain CCMP1381" /LENGTH=87 /DNA_ID=CAMNT_0028492927 /DNA_START=655 /DNA_END=918 /DNA_ORIENTATION=+